MRSSGPISLFNDRPQNAQRPISFVISIFAHGAGIALIFLGILFTPRIDDRIITEHFSLRHLELELPEPPVRHPGVKYPGPQQMPPAPSPDAHDNQAERPSVARQVAQVTPAPQTLVQPKLQPKTLDQKIPLPTVVIWKQEDNALSKIIPPLPQKPTTALVRPSVAAPNEETILADVGITSSELARIPLPISPSTTSPVVTTAQDTQQEPPATTSQNSAQPAPAAIVSLSDLRAQGDVVLPPVNQTASGSSTGLLAPGRPDDLGKSDGGGKGAQAANANGAAQPGNTSGPGVGANGTETAERIALPHDGQFGSVIVGSSLQDMYPETEDVWGGRMAYTVYLHVGLRKSWILQYSLPPAGDAAAAGTTMQLAAPWPYTIIRPNLAAGVINADALMVHGIINKAGKFETLAVAFPTQFPQSEFVLNSLKQWEFRPATQGGKVTAVEVLLIIPEEAD